ncbi:hypothetical protein VC83_01722 [Pseudogymnoascus destructans]|uniref:Uncharacterized protein n=1 Tax=Pseudogymnoascus destructans TaxID=655981 RepID=A0A177AIT3_9PEZI|nr:uncharacterized protein VC83_01722 [Pseudogymnoascus destructans]OAF61978.1 hypothetical protein VC83_01722 [Pseudogymnoascus destructans]
MLDIAYKQLVQHHRLRHGTDAKLGLRSIAWTLGSDTNNGPHLPGGCGTCRGLVVVDTGAGTYSKTLDYYLMGQFSRFVPRGATALSTTGSKDYGGGQKFEAMSFVEADGSRTVVVQNTFGNEVFLTVTFKGVAACEWVRGVMGRGLIAA